jgi:hypothetical protein
VALHATDPASVYLAAAARMSAPTVGAVEQALYDDRSLVRPARHAADDLPSVPVGLAPIMQSACTDAIAVVERRKLVAHIEQGGVTRTARRGSRGWVTPRWPPWRSGGEALATELSADVPDLAAELRVGEGKKVGGHP